MIVAFGDLAPRTRRRSLAETCEETMAAFMTPTKGRPPVGDRDRERHESGIKFRHSRLTWSTTSAIYVVSESSTNVDDPTGFTGLLNYCHDTCNRKELKRSRNSPYVPHMKTVYVKNPPRERVITTVTASLSRGIPSLPNLYLSYSIKGKCKEQTVLVFLMNENLVRW